MDTLIEHAIKSGQFTSIRMTKNSITFSNKPKKPRQESREGDVKWMRGKRYVRRQRRYDGCYVVNRGRPVWNWEQEDDPKQPNPPEGYKPRDIIRKQYY